MADHHEYGTMNVTEQRNTFKGVMTFTAKHGAPGSMGLAVFFVSLLLHAGIFSVVAGLITYFFFRWVLMTFFAH